MGNGAGLLYGYQIGGGYQMNINSELSHKIFVPLIMKRQHGMEGIQTRLNPVVRCHHPPAFPSGGSSACLLY